MTPEPPGHKCLMHTVQQVLVHVCLSLFNIMMKCYMMMSVCQVVHDDVDPARRD